MRRVVISAVLGVVSAVSASAQSSPNALPASPPPAAVWTWRPSLFMLASVDENTDPPVGVLPITFEEPGFAGNLGAGLDGTRRTASSRLIVELFGLMRSPVSSPDRAMYVGNRIGWSWQVAPAWRFDFRDSGKLQRQPALEIAGFQRNHAAAAVEWRPPTSPLGVTFELADRRRSLPAVELLGFERQSAALELVSSTTTSAAEVGIGFQRYRARTASGRRLVVSGEVARFGRAFIGSARYAFVGSGANRLTPFTGDGGEQAGEFSDIDRADFLEQLASVGSDATLPNEIFSLDPLETDSDDWDFGRRKHVVMGYVSRNVASSGVLSGSIRYQRRQGPNLLAPEESPLAAPFSDSRLALRLGFRQPISTRLFVIAQVSYLRNTGDRPLSKFSRRLLGIGLQIQF